MKPIDIHNPNYYENGKPEKIDRTEKRLKEISDLGMTETGNFSFGIEGVMSGLYIEKVWSYSDEDFDGYLDWVRSLLALKNKKIDLSQPVRALSWKEPFASAMIIGKIETRTWDTKYRGLVLICASQKKYSEGDIIAISGEVQSQRLLVDFINNKRIIENPGKAIAIGRLIDSRPMTPNDESATFVKYRPGLYCHVYADVTPIKPFDWKGSQGWRTVSEEIKSKIEFL